MRGEIYKKRLKNGRAPEADPLDGPRVAGISRSAAFGPFLDRISIIHPRYRVASLIVRLADTFVPDPSDRRDAMCPRIPRVRLLLSLSPSTRCDLISNRRGRFSRPRA